MTLLKNKEKIRKYTIELPASISHAIKKMDVSEVNTIIISRKDIVIGVFTLGDFRRSVLKGLDINESIETVINSKFISVNDSRDVQGIINIFKNNKYIIDIPVLDDNKQLVDVINREEFLDLHHSNIDLIESQNDIPVVIMAGGKGTRLDPFTRVLPKPLIPVGDDPILRVIMNKFIKYSYDKFYISLGEKKEMIKAYLQDSKYKNVVEFVEESQPLGTVGALSMLSDTLDGSFFVTNCDIVINTNYKEILNFHSSSKNDITIIASLRNYTIPYGVCKLDEHGQLKHIDEKPPA